MSFARSCKGIKSRKYIASTAFRCLKSIFFFHLLKKFNLFINYLFRNFTYLSVALKKQIKL